MRPVDLRTRRLVLDQPRASDRDLIAEYCTDPVFEHTMATPWPYLPEHADAFIERFVPDGWATGREFTWALRRDGVFLGVVSYRVDASDVGFWLGAPFRGNGYLPEALGAVADWVFSRGVESIAWEAFEGNTASASAARKAGFTFTGTGPTRIPGRDGAPRPGWHGVLRGDDDRSPKPGWPLP